MNARQTFDPSARVLLGPGPSMAHPRVMRALGAPTVGHLDPELLALYAEEQDLLRTMPVTDLVAATSVGIVAGEPMLDLAYVEDSRADVDMNVVKTGTGLFIELQGTAEALPFGREALNRLLDLADSGTRQLFALQRGLVGQYLDKPRG